MSKKNSQEFLPVESIHFLEPLLDGLARKSLFFVGGIFSFLERALGVKLFIKIPDEFKSYSPELWQMLCLGMKLK